MLLRKAITLFLSQLNYYYKFFSIFNASAKQVIKNSYLVNFTEQEASFLSQCAHSFNYQIDYSLGFRQKELFTVKLKQVTFLGNTGALVADNKLIIESVFDQLRSVKSPVFRMPSFMWHKRKQGLYTSIIHLPWAEKSNYHWFIDCLPRLCLLLETVREPVKIIFARNMPVFQQETLRFLLQDKPNFSIEEIGKNEKWHVSDFIFPSFVSNHLSGYLPDSILHKIRTSVWQGYKVSDTTGNTRIYISRRKATKRKILNEPALIEILKQFQFKTIYAEDLSYLQQVQLFYSAVLIVAPHGAGLTNILFSKSCQVFELHPADILRSHYFMLCKALSFPYHYLIGDKPDKNQNFSVNLENFETELRNILAFS